MKIAIYMTVAIITLTVGASALDNFLSTHVNHHEATTTVSQKTVSLPIQAQLKLK